MPKEYTLIGGNGTRVSPLEVNESGTYEAGDSRAFNPVKVNVPSGSSTLSGLTDVDISNPSDGQTLVYDAASEKWVNGDGSGAGGILITVDTTSELDPIPADKTCGEVMSAINAKLPVYCKFVISDSEYTISIMRDVVYYASASGLADNDPVYQFDFASVHTLAADTLNDTLVMLGGK